MGSFCSEQRFQSLGVAVEAATVRHDATRQKVDLVAAMLQDVGLLNRSGEFILSLFSLIASLKFHQRRPTFCLGSL
jgi:hypothetical protein